MHVMSSVSPANENESCAGGLAGGGALAILTPPQNAGPSPSPPPPPPAAPPPPPPPLPPPPPPDGPGGFRKKRRVRSFFWKPIPEERVRERADRPNVWSLALRSHAQQHYQIDARSVEELFGNHDDARATGRSRAAGRSGSFKENKEEISILDSKRSMNVGIFLKQFKKSNISIIEDIRYGNSEPYGAEPLRELLKLLPESEEVRKLGAFRGDSSKLTLVDSFMFLLTQVPSFEVRIEAMVLKEEFSPSCSAMNHDISVVRAATKELMSCEELHAILHLVLQAGNIMNAGGYAGNAVGFKLSSLLSLADTKANKPGMNLLHFVALEAQKKDKHLLSFTEKLQHVQSAARVSVESVELEFESLSSRTRSVEERTQSDAELLQQLELFLQSSERALQGLKQGWVELRKEGNALIDFFCEDKDAFKLDECFRIFQDFCLKFKKAVKDNVERDLKEAARRHRLRELEEKRHSWAGREESGGVFGMRCSSETDVEVALTREVGLLDLLKTRPRSPQSPLGRSGSTRRSRHSPAAVADRQLTSFLEMTSDLVAKGDDVNFDPLAKGHYYHSLTWAGHTPLSRTASPHSPPSYTHSPSHTLSPPSYTHSPSHTLFPSHTHPLSHTNTHSNSNRNTSDLGVNNSRSPADSNSTDHNRNAINQQTTANAHTHTHPCGPVTMSLERHTLISGLRAFDLVPAPPHGLHDDRGHRSNADDDVTLTDLEAEGEDAESLAPNAPPSSLSRAGERREGRREDDVCQATEENDGAVSVGAAVTRESEVGVVPVLTDADVDHSEAQESESKDDLTGTASSSDGCTSTNELSVSPLLPASTNEQSGSLSTDVSSEPSSTNELSASLSLPAFTNELSVSPPTNEASLPASTNEQTRVSQSTNESSVSQSTNEGSVWLPSDASPVSDSKSDPEQSTETPAVAVETPGKTSPSKPKTPNPTPSSSKTPAGSPKPAAPRPVRTLTSSEAQGLRKVVPITRLTRSGSTARRAPDDHRVPVRPGSAPQPEDPKGPRAGVHAGAREQTQPAFRKPSLRKPGARPARVVPPRPPPEEKMCRSTMRALAAAAAAAGGGSGGQGGAERGTTSSSSSPAQTPTRSPASAARLPGFARNTVSSTTRVAKQVVTPGNNGTAAAATSPKPSPLSRTASLRLPPESPAGPQAGAGLLMKRAGSIRVPSRRPLADTQRGHTRKNSGSFSDKSAHSRDSAPHSDKRDSAPSHGLHDSKPLKPLWR